MPTPNKRSFPLVIWNPTSKTFWHLYGNGHMQGGKEAPEVTPIRRKRATKKALKALEAFFSK